MKIDFEFTTRFGKFADALWFPDDQPLPSEDEINAMKQRRVDNWINAVVEASNAPSIDVVETPPVDVVETPPDEPPAPEV